jgi:hypothetical protein
MKLAGFGVTCVLILMTSLSARAADTSYLGTWKLTDAAVAPWADAKRKPDDTEKTRLIGKTMVIAARQISGPKPLVCPSPHYKIVDYTADMIFQGAFGEMQSSNKSVDPGKIASSLGFTGSRIRTLETGCEIDIHFVDATTAEVGLNDYVYTLKKQ